MILWFALWLLPLAAFILAAFMFWRAVAYVYTSTTARLELEQ